MSSFVAPFSMKCLSLAAPAFVAAILVFCPLDAVAGSIHDAEAMSSDFDTDDAGVDDAGVNNDLEGWFEIPEEQITDDLPDSPSVAALLLSSAEQEQSPTNEPLYLTEPFANINFGVGYFHPALDISSRHGSGFALHLDAMFSGERWAIGPHIRTFFSSSSEEHVYTLGEPDTRSDPTRLTPRPIAFLAGMSVRYAIHKSKRWFVSVGLTVAMMDYFLTFKETSSKDPDKYKEYERNRTGIAFMEDVDVAYFFASSGEYSIGPYLSLGIAEAYSWDTDEVQPDLDRKDGRVFGLELWPQFILGLKILRGERPENEVEFNVDPEKQPLENEHFRLDIAFGYSHPLGPISRDYPPGLAANTHVLLRMKELEFGIFFAIGESTSGSDKITLPPNSEYNSKDWPVTLDSNPSGITTGFVFNPIVETRGAFLLSAGLHLGFAWRDIGRGSKTDSSGNEEAAYTDFRRERAGIAFGQHIDGCWFFVSEKAGVIGVFARAAIDEAYTWSIGKYQPDLQGPDESVYGLEWWPSISGGFIFML